MADQTHGFVIIVNRPGYMPDEASEPFIGTLDDARSALVAAIELTAECSYDAQKGLSRALQRAHHAYIGTCIEFAGWAHTIELDRGD